MAEVNSWTISSSDNEDEASILPASPHGKQFASPAQIKKQLLIKAGKHGSSTSDKPACPYGEKCYRKNPDHFKEYSHPQTKKTSDVKLIGNGSKDQPMTTENIYTPPKKKLKLSRESLNPLDVWESSAPHYFLLTTCKGIPREFNYCNPQSRESKSFPPSLGIRDILSERFGQLKQSAQFNYCIDIEWLMDQYPKTFRNKPLLVVHGEQGGGSMRLQAETEPFPNIQLCRADLPPYGTHHTKMMLLLYENGLRVIILTANLVPQDWSQKTQGLWMSPIFPPLIGEQNPNTRQFKNDLIIYMSAYKKKPLASWIEVVRKHDLSSANVTLIASVPGRHTGPVISTWGHMRLRKELKMKIKRVDSSWPVIGQFSSIGSLGSNENKWLCNEWLTSMSSCDTGKFLTRTTAPAPLKLIFPTVDNIRCSLEGYPAGASVPYSSANAKKQGWLRSFMHQWNASHAGRSEASPHIKSYTRISPYDTNIRSTWFLLTSANLSKAAWGALEKNGSQLAIKSFELGVLFIPPSPDSENKSTNSSNPQILNDSYFHINSTSKTKNRFPMPFHIPLTPYAHGDESWTWNAPHTDAPDRHGNIWEPS